MSTPTEPRGPAAADPAAPRPGTTPAPAPANGPTAGTDAPVPAANGTANGAATPSGAADGSADGPAGEAGSGAADGPGGGPRTAAPNGAAGAPARAARGAGTGPGAPARRQPRGWLPGPASSALTRYRVVAYVVGVGLVILVLIGVPLRYAANVSVVVAIVGPVHGFLYIVYLVFTADLALRWRWSLVRTVLVMAAGTVPFLSFVAEHFVTKQIRADTRD